MVQGPTKGGRTADHRAKRRTASQMKKVSNPNPVRRKTQRDMTRKTRRTRVY